jgi:hypothetical protein
MQRIDIPATSLVNDRATAEGVEPMSESNASTASTKDTDHAAGPWSDSHYQMLLHLDQLGPDNVKLALRVVGRMVNTDADGRKIPDPGSEDREVWELIQMSRGRSTEEPSYWGKPRPRGSAAAPEDPTAALHRLGATIEARKWLIEFIQPLGAEDLNLLRDVALRMFKTDGFAPDSFLEAEMEWRAEVRRREREAEASDTARSDDPETAVDTSVVVPEPDAPANEAPALAESDEPMPDTLRQFSTIAARAELDNVLDALGAGEVDVLVRVAKGLRQQGTEVAR